MERFKVTFDKSIGKQHKLLRDIAEQEGGYTIEKFGPDYIIIRNDLEPSNEDEQT